MKVKEHLPKVPERTIYFEECNCDERGMCDVYTREVMGLSNITNDPSMPSMKIARTKIKINNLCQNAASIPITCPKFAKLTADIDLNLYITVRAGVFGVQYDKLKKDMMDSMGDIPQPVKDARWAERESQLVSSVIDTNKLRDELSNMGLPEEIIEKHIEQQINEMKYNVRRHFIYTLGLRCPNCWNGEVDTETGECKKCGQNYHTVLNRHREKLEKVLQETENA